MRTTVTHEKEKQFTFSMTDSDVLERVDEVNELKSQEQSLESKKRLISNEIKQKKSDIDFKLNCISRREEPRKVMCDVVYDYEKRTIEVLFDGSVMESKKMSDWEFEERPTDVYPETHKYKVEEKAEEGTAEAAVERAEEISDKVNQNQVPSANVNAYSEAKVETAIEGLNV